MLLTLIYMADDLNASIRRVLNAIFFFTLMSLGGSNGMAGPSHSLLDDWALSETSLICDL